jgi:hypothetical protein
MLDDESRDSNCRKDSSHVHFRRERQHLCKRPRARGQALHPSPRCPDLLVPRHVRIHHVHGFARPPRADPPSLELALDEWGAARICVTVEHDQGGGARRMCRREQGSGRERGVRCDENRFAAPDGVEHRGDAVGPLLQGRHCVRNDRIGCAGARLVEVDQPTERRHRIDPTLNGRQLRQNLAAREPVRHGHDVASALA